MYFYPLNAIYLKGGFLSRIYRQPSKNLFFLEVKAYFALLASVLNPFIVRLFREICEVHIRFSKSNYLN